MGRGTFRFPHGLHTPKGIALCIQKTIQHPKGAAFGLPKGGSSRKAAL